MEYKFNQTLNYISFLYISLRVSRHLGLWCCFKWKPKGLSPPTTIFHQTGQFNCNSKALSSTLGTGYASHETFYNILEDV